MLVSATGRIPMKLTPILVGAFSVALAASASAQTLTIATVNNGDMIRMQGLSSAFTEETGIELNWVVLEENTLRQNVTTDIATNGGQYDVMTIGTYEAPIWARQRSEERRVGKVCRSQRAT